MIKRQKTLNHIVLSTLVLRFLRTGSSQLYVRFNLPDRQQDAIVSMDCNSFRAFCLPSGLVAKTILAGPITLSTVSSTDSNHMAFHPAEKLRSRRIKIDLSSSTCDSPDIQQRLDRIEANYDQLDIVLVDIENKIALDERLSALDDDNVDFEAEFGIKPKRKWRPAKTKRKRRSAKSANPRKPR